MSNLTTAIDERMERLHSLGLVDLHFDLLMDLYEKRDQRNVLTTEFLPEFAAGHLTVLGAAIYIEDRYIPEMALRVSLGQIARLYSEVDLSNRFAICETYQAILEARDAGRIAFLITMEGVEPIGSDPELLRVFFELGVRAIGLTHARRNAAGTGGVFRASGSSPEGLTNFGRELVQGCEQLGIMVDLAHINPKGFEDVFAVTTKPLIVSHTNARRYYDIERNISDEQIRMIGQRGGVVGINAVLVSPEGKGTTLDRYVDHIEHVAGLIGIDCVGIGFDFFEFIYRQWPASEQKALAAKLTKPHFIPDLRNHADAPKLIRKLIERGFSDEQIAKILSENWMRVFAQWL